MQASCTVAFCEHKHATVVGSQQRMRSRDQTRRSGGIVKVVRRASGQPVDQWNNCSARGKANASGDDVLRGCLGSISSVSPVVWVA